MRTAFTASTAICENLAVSAPRILELSVVWGERGWEDVPWRR